MAAPAFAVLDCSLSRLATGRSCSTLRELLGAMHSASDEVLDHHMMRCALEDHFELHEFPNDFSLWVWDALGDRALAEQLALVDPYVYSTPNELREAIVCLLERRMWEHAAPTACLPGRELHLVESRLVVYETGEKVTSPAALAAALPSLSRHSLYYHFHEAHRRNQGKSDDFSAWLEECGADGTLVNQLRRLDFHFLNLNQLRNAMLAVFRQHMEMPNVQIKGVA